MQKGRSLRLPQAKEGSGLFIRIIRRIFALSADNSELTRVGRSGSVLFDDAFFLSSFADRAGQWGAAVAIAFLAIQLHGDMDMI